MAAVLRAGVPVGRPRQAAARVQGSRQPVPALLSTCPRQAGTAQGTIEDLPQPRQPPALVQSSAPASDLTALAAAQQVLVALPPPVSADWMSLFDRTLFIIHPCLDAEVSSLQLSSCGQGWLRWAPGCTRARFGLNCMWPLGAARAAWQGRRWLCADRAA